MKRFVQIAAACAALCCAPAALAKTAHHQTQPTVSCAVGICITHFTVQISGSQNTSWKVPQHRFGAADCYEVPYVSGDGGQDITFKGSSRAVEATRIGSGQPDFTELVGGRLDYGMGHGPASVNRYGDLIFHTTGGPCGDNNVPDSNGISGCRSMTQQWEYSLAYHANDEVGLTGGSNVAPLSDSCPLEWTGIADDTVLDGLYAGLTVPLPPGELYNPRIGKVVVHANRTYSEPPPLGFLYSPISGRTTIRWTVTLTRIAHAQFPLRSAQ